MRKIVTIHSPAVLVPTANIDTDQIIPARFLKTTSREGFGKKLFYDWRYAADGSPVRNNIIDRQLCCPEKEASFADIFRNNALNNALLPVQVSSDFLASLMAAMEADHTLAVDIDLPAQTISAEGAGTERFSINGYKKECLLKGYSDIDYLLAHKDRIVEYEERHR